MFYGSDNSSLAASPVTNALCSGWPSTRGEADGFAACRRAGFKNQGPLSVDQMPPNGESLHQGHELLLTSMLEDSEVGG